MRHLDLLGAGVRLHDDPAASASSGTGIAESAGPDVPGSPAPAPLPRSAAVLAALRRGGTVPSIARETGAPEAFVATMVDHYRRLGLLAGSGSLCSSGLGACEPGKPGGELSDVARVQCAGCPLAIRPVD